MPVMGAQSSHIQFFSSTCGCVATRPRVRLVVRQGAFGRASGRPNPVLPKIVYSAALNKLRNQKLSVIFKNWFFAYSAELFLATIRLFGQWFSFIRPIGQRFSFIRPSFSSVFRLFFVYSAGFFVYSATSLIRHPRRYMLVYSAIVVKRMFFSIYPWGGDLGG